MFCIWREVCGFWTQRVRPVPASQPFLRSTFTTTRLSNRQSGVGRTRSLVGSETRHPSPHDRRGREEIRTSSTFEPSRPLRLSGTYTTVFFFRSFAVDRARRPVLGFKTGRFPRPKTVYASTFSSFSSGGRARVMAVTLSMGISHDAVSAQLSRNSIRRRRWRRRGRPFRLSREDSEHPQVPRPYRDSPVGRVRLDNGSAPKRQKRRRWWPNVSVATPFAAPIGGTLFPQRRTLKHDRCSRVRICPTRRQITVKSGGGVVWRKSNAHRYVRYVSYESENRHIVISPVTSNAGDTIRKKTKCNDIQLSNIHTIRYRMTVTCPVLFLEGMRKKLFWNEKRINWIRSIHLPF